MRSCISLYLSGCSARCDWDFYHADRENGVWNPSRARFSRLTITALETTAIDRRSKILFRRESLNAADRHVVLSLSLSRARFLLQNACEKENARKKDDIRWKRRKMREEGSESSREKVVCDVFLNEGAGTRPPILGSSCLVPMTRIVRGHVLFLSHGKSPAVRFRGETNVRFVLPSLPILPSFYFPPFGFWSRRDADESGSAILINICVRGTDVIAMTYSRLYKLFKFRRSPMWKY